MFDSYLKTKRSSQYLKGSFQCPQAPSIPHWPSIQIFLPYFLKPSLGACVVTPY